MIKPNVLKYKITKYSSFDGEIFKNTIYMEICHIYTYQRKLLCKEMKEDDEKWDWSTFPTQLDEAIIKVN